MRDDDFDGLIKDDSGDEVWYEVKKVNPVVSNILLWCGIVAGVAVGVMLFLFFLTIFLYFFLPLALIMLAIYAFKRWQINRKWKKFTDSL